MKAATKSKQFISQDARQVGRMLALFGLLGVFAGLAAVVFAWTIETSTEFILGTLASSQRMPGAAAFDLSWPQEERWLLLIIPTVGGLLSGVLCAWLAPEAMGAGINHSVDTYHNHNGQVRKRVPIVKTLASSLTLSSGGSGGVEGPIAQISGGIGTLLSQAFGLSNTDRRLMMMAGFAAGVGAIFHAPMAAAIFAAEVLYSEMDIEHEVLVPGILASTVAYGVFGAIWGWEPIFDLPELTFGHSLELVSYLALAIVLAGAAIIFAYAFRNIRQRLGRASSVPLWLRPAIGGFGVGIIGLWVPSALGAGYDIVEIALEPQTPIVVLVILATAKLITTALTVGSGGASGLFAPSLVIGGALGGVVGIATSELFPNLSITPASFVVVGMAGFFAAVSKAPISTVIMVAEVVGDYRLIVPTLWVCALTWLLSRGHVVYTEQVATRYDAPSHLSDMMGAVLHRIRVSEAMPEKADAPVTVPPDMTLRELVNVFAHTAQTVFPVVKPTNGKLLGVVDGIQLRRTIGEKGVDTFLIANDFIAPAHTITKGDTLFETISRMTAYKTEELVVVDSKAPDQLIGIISRRDVITAYHRRMLDRAPLDATEDFESKPESTLAEAIKRGGIVKGVTATTPQQALNQIIARAQLPQGCDRGRLVSLLIAREELGSTGVGDGIAVPHPNTDNLGVILQPKVIIGLLKKPVDWKAYDGKPVDTVCVLLCPSGDVHLKMLGDLARSLTNPHIRKLLSRRVALNTLVNGVNDVLDSTDK